MDKMAGIVDLFKDIAIEFGAEIFSIGTMKKFITKSLAQKATGKATETSIQTPEGQNIGIKAGGMFNLSDEEAYLALMAKLEISDEDINKKLAFKVSKTVNEELPLEDQKRRFRVVFGRLSQIEYTKEIDRHREEIPQSKGDPRIKETIKEKKLNLAVECLKSFINYTRDERSEVYKAMGIMESELKRKLDSAKRWIDDHEEKVTSVLGQANKAVSGDSYQGFWKELKKTLWPF